MAQLEIKLAASSEARHILRRTLHADSQTPAQLEAQVSAFMLYARRMRLPLDRQWWLLADGVPLSACNCVESPGRSAVLFLPPGGSISVRTEELAVWLRAIVREQRGRDLRLLQCLLAPGDEKNAAALSMAGFRHLAELCYLERGPLIADLPAPPTAGQRSSHDWIHYDNCNHADFARLIQSTYQGSLDCPGLAGLRDIEDVIAGHKAAGRFDPRRWLLLRVGRISAGCILLSENPLRTSMEIVYLGVRPEMRKRGVGALLLHRGLQLAYADGLAKVTVAVDSANEPALRLYGSAGFVPNAWRRVMILPLEPRSDGHGGCEQSGGLSTCF